MSAGDNYAGNNAENKPLTRRQLKEMQAQRDIEDSISSPPSPSESEPSQSPQPSQPPQPVPDVSAASTTPEGAALEHHPAPPALISVLAPPQVDAQDAQQQYPLPEGVPTSVPFLRVRKFANDLLVKHHQMVRYGSYLEEVLRHTGAMEVVELRNYIQTLRNEYAALVESFNSYQQSTYAALDAEVSATRDALSAEVATARREIQEDKKNTKATLNSLTAQTNEEVYQARLEIARLNEELIDLRTAAVAQATGLYDFEHPAEESARLSDELSAVRAEIKEMIKEGAYTASNNFTFNGSTRSGTKFIKQMGTMLLSSYNAEAENGIKSIRAGNLAAAQKRLQASLVRIEKNGVMIDLKIKRAYHKLRLRELELAAKHLEAVKALREQEKEQRAELREQQKAEVELKKAHEQLEKERAHKQNVLAAIRERANATDSPDPLDLEKIAELEESIAEIEASEGEIERRSANSRAGYVYVISNTGSFGEGMIKIGMTRRLDPMDRVKELGDASVPFGFDVHALFFSEDAYGIEAMLHREFSHRRVNLINTRREHFYATPAEVLEKLQESNVALVEYKVDAPAEDYKQSQLLRNSFSA